MSNINTPYLGETPMINEANKILSHNECEQVIARCWRGSRFWTMTECKLPSGKVADVLGYSMAGDVFIAEVKHLLKSSLMEDAMNKYREWSNFLYIAVAGAVDADLDRHVPVTGFLQPWHRVGVIGVYPNTMRVLRPASFHRTQQQNKLAVERIVHRDIDAGRVGHVAETPIAVVNRGGAADTMPNR